MEPPKRQELLAKLFLLYNNIVTTGVLLMPSTNVEKSTEALLNLISKGKKMNVECTNTFDFINVGERMMVLLSIQILEHFIQNKDDSFFNLPLVNYLCLFNRNINILVAVRKDVFEPTYKYVVDFCAQLYMFIRPLNSTIYSTVCYDVNDINYELGNHTIAYETIDMSVSMLNDFLQNLKNRYMLEECLDARELNNVGVPLFTDDVDMSEFLLFENRRNEFIKTDSVHGNQYGYRGFYNYKYHV